MHHLKIITVQIMLNSQFLYNNKRFFERKIVKPLYHFVQMINDFLRKINDTNSRDTFTSRYRSRVQRPVINARVIRVNPNLKPRNNWGDRHCPANQLFSLNGTDTLEYRRFRKSLPALHSPNSRLLDQSQIACVNTRASFGKIRDIRFSSWKNRVFRGQIVDTPLFLLEMKMPRFINKLYRENCTDT